MTADEVLVTGKIESIDLERIVDEQGETKIVL